MILDIVAYFFGPPRIATHAPITCYVLKQRTFSLG